MSAPLSRFPWMTRDEVFRIETPRLWLRWSESRDADALQQIASHEAVATMTSTWPHPLAADEAATRIDAARAMNAAGEALILSLSPKAEPGMISGAIVGQIGAKVLGASHFSIGYMVDPEHQGLGLASEAVHAMRDGLFTYALAQRISASVRIINPASKRVLEKNGFTHVRTGPVETPVRGEVEVDFLELTRARWVQERAETRRMSVQDRSALRRPTRDNSSAIDNIPV